MNTKELLDMYIKSYGDLRGAIMRHPEGSQDNKDMKEKILYWLTRIERITSKIEIKP